MIAPTLLQQLSLFIPDILLYLELREHAELCFDSEITIDLIPSLIACHSKLRRHVALLSDETEYVLR